MSFAKVMEFISYIEDKYPVASWTVDALHVWPLIRISMAYSFIVDYSSKLTDNQEAKNTFSDMNDQAGEELGRNGNWLEQHTDAVFLSLTDTARVKVGDALHDSICDYLMQLLEDKNVSSLIIGLSKKYDLEQVSSTQIVDLKRFNGIIAGNMKLHTGLTYSLCGLDGFNKELAHFLKINNSTIPLYDINRVKRLATEVRAYADFFSLILCKLRPALGFVACYYDLVGMAFILACRENNIVSFDLQHGHQTDIHFAYAGWSNVPEQGYELLPDYFWCWSKNEADIINRWSNRKSSVHRPFIGGNPWHEAVKGCIAKDFSEQIDILSSLQHGKLNVLYTHQATYGIDDWIIDAIENSPDSWFWWIRLHPRTEAGEKSMIVEKLDKCRNRNFEIQTPTALPLPILLNYMDVHVTGFSSCIAEAEHYGLLSVVTHPYGIEHYPEYIKEERIAAAFDSKELISAVTLQSGRRGNKGHIDKDNSELLSSAVNKITIMVEESRQKLLSSNTAIQGKEPVKDLNLQYYYLNIAYYGGNYYSIIDGYGDSKDLPALYFVAKAYNALKNENSALLYFAKVIDRLNSLDNTDETDISEMNLLNIYSDIVGIAIRRIDDPGQHRLFASIRALCYENSVFRELYLKELFQAGLYNHITTFKDCGQPDTDYYTGRAYKSQLQYEDSKTYLFQYISAFENNRLDRNLMVSNKSFAASAYFHMGEICYLQLLNAEAYDYFVKCKALSETAHIKADEYLSKINKMLW